MWRKKLFLYLIILFIAFQNLYGFEVNLGKVFETIGNNSVNLETLDLFFDSKDELICLFPRVSNRESVFLIDTKYECISITYESVEKKGGENAFFDNGNEKYRLNGNYFLLIKNDSTFMYNSSFINENGKKVYPYYMFINDANMNEVFDFNKWRMDDEVFYPKTYYNSLSERKVYTKEEQLKILNNFKAYTSYEHHTAVNKKQNRIAVVFDKYNGERGALVIFQILYDAKCNDDKVRVRAEPNLNCETKTYLNKNDAVKITDQSDKRFEIEGKKYYWYEVELADKTSGWVYGKYLDIEE